MAAGVVAGRPIDRQHKLDCDVVSGHDSASEGSELDAPTTVEGAALALGVV